MKKIIYGLYINLYFVLLILIFFTDESNSNNYSSVCEFNNFAGDSLIIESHEDYFKIENTNPENDFPKYEKSVFDLPIFYTSGFYNKWYAKDYVSDGIGLKKIFGKLDSINNVEYLGSERDSTNSGHLWIIGPDYFQEISYPMLDTVLGNKTVNYNLRINARKGELLSNNVIENPKDTLLKIEVTVNYLLNGKEYSYILSTFYVEDGHLSTQFDSFPYFLGIYNYWDFLEEFETIHFPSNKIEGFSNYFKGENFNSDEIYCRGIQYKIYWMGKREVHFDYFELYDDYIWKNFVYNPITTALQLKTFEIEYEKHHNGKPKYWYNSEEPYLIDSIEPFRIVYDILNNNNVK